MKSAMMAFLSGWIVFDEKGGKPVPFTSMLLAAQLMSLDTLPLLPPPPPILLIKGNVPMRRYGNSKTLNYPFKTDPLMGSSVATFARYLQVSPSNSSFYSSQLCFHECQNNCTFQQGTVHRCNERGKEVISTTPLPFVLNVLNKGSACAVSRHSLHQTSTLCSS